MEKEVVTNIFSAYAILIPIYSDGYFVRGFWVCHNLPTFAACN